MITAAAAVAAPFVAPDNLAFGAGGRTYVTDNDGTVMRVVVVDRAGTPVATWNDFKRVPGKHSGPEGIATDAAGNVYVSDAGQCRIDEFSPAGAIVRTYGTCGNAPGQLDAPGHVAVDASGNVYVSDSGRPAVTIYTPAGRLFAYLPRPIGATPGVFRFPQGVAVAANGRIYVEDWGNRRVLVLDRSGNVRIAIDLLRGAYPVRNSAGIAVAGDRLYVADWRAHRIVVFDATGSVVRVITNDPGQRRFFEGPTSIAVDARGRLYFADGRTIRVLDANGKPIAVWGAAKTASPNSTRASGAITSPLQYHMPRRISGARRR